MRDVEKHTDPIDKGSEIAENDRRNRELLQRQKAQPKQVKKEDGTWPHPECDECGEEIGEARLEATGAVHCIDCATLFEKKGKQYARR